MSVRPHGNKNSARTERIFMKFDVTAFFINLSRKLKFYCHLTRITRALHKDLFTLMIVSRCLRPVKPCCKLYKDFIRFSTVLRCPEEASSFRTYLRGTYSPHG
jgi:hypothetical protein